MESNPIEFADKLYIDVLFFCVNEEEAKKCCDLILRLLMREATTEKRLLYDLARVHIKETK